MKSLLILSIVLVAFMGLVSADPACSININAKTVQDLTAEMPAINAQLQSCPLDIPPALRFISKTGNALITVTMNDGTTSQFAFLTLFGEITGAQVGTTSSRLEITTTENSLNAALNSPDPVMTILSLYQSKGLTIKSPRFFTQAKLTVVKPFVGFFIPASEKPKRCDETWIPGHRGYAENKDVWDGYSANTQGVCQSNQPVSCVHTVQLSISGNPYYLCWY
jgi:hypothetical protein